MSSWSWNASLMMVASAAMYSLQNLDVKRSQRYYDVWVIIFFRGVVGTIISWMYISIFRVKPKHVRALCVRGVLGAVTITTAFYALHLLSITFVVIVTSTASLWTGLFSYARGNGNWYIQDTVASMLCISGVTLVTTMNGRHDSSPYFIMGICTALVSAVSQGMVNVTIQDIRDEDPVMVTMFSMVMSGLVAGFAVLVNRSPMRPSIPMIEMSLCGILSLIAQYLKTQSLQESEDVSIILLRYFDIVFSIMWDMLFFGLHISRYQIIGSCFIVAGAILPMVIVRSRN